MASCARCEGHLGRLSHRVHRHPQTELFPRFDSGDCPVDPSKIEKGKLTRMTFVGGAGEECEHVLVDLWDAEISARRMAYHCGVKHVSNAKKI